MTPLEILTKLREVYITFLGISTYDGTRNMELKNKCQGS